VPCWSFIHPSAWKWDSANFAFTEFSKKFACTECGELRIVCATLESHRTKNEPGLAR
jgi:hypothetical protein